MSDLICRKTMMRCQTPGMCAPYGGCRTEVAIPDDQVLVPREWLSALIGEISHGWGESFEESEIAEQIRTLLYP
ncbi:hypothetical protein ACQCLI_18360 [Pseudomonas nitroreducens]|uniref:hypothetical protein n=1 Tax=Pseudomonas nitroreducens TaxID=46680 RepID=UPI00038103D3|nr:hypothetical protein [Pseudomonas nitroreducens]